MLGRESPQRSFFDAGLAVEDLLEPGSIYELLYRLGPRLVSDDDFADCYDLTDGRPSAPPARIFKVLLLQNYEDLSDREAIARMAFDLRWKAALGLEVHSRAVAQSTLVEHRARIQLHEKMEEAFSRFVQGLVEAGVIAADQVQILDSSAIWGRGAVEDTYNLIGSAVRKLLGAGAKKKGCKTSQLAGDLGLVLTAPAESGSLKGRAEIDWSDVDARRGFLNEIVEEARVVLAALVESDPDDSEVAEAAGLLRRILMQDLEPAAEPTNRDDGGGGGGGEDEAQAVLALGQEVQIRQGVAPDRVVSVSDPDMRHGHKSRNRHWEGYKAHVSVEAGHGFITAIEVSAANVHDAQAARDLLRAQQAQGLNPSANVGDMAYSKAEFRSWAQEQGTEIVAKVTPAPGTAGCFRKEEFDVDLDAGTVRCPAGQSTNRFTQRADGRRAFFFEGTICAACPLRDRCTRIAPAQMIRSGRGRSLEIHPHEAILQAARAAEHSERTQHLLRLRWMAERSLAHLMRRRLRQARYRRRPKTQFQAVTAALVVNLNRLAALLAGSNPSVSWSPV